MNKHIENIRLTRMKLMDYVADLSLEALNKIPEGFGNNIIWNLGHLVAAQESLCYRRSGQMHLIDLPFFEAYKPGSRPQGWVDEGGVRNIKERLLTSLDELDSRLAQGLSGDAYETFASPYGVVIGNIEEAVAFLPYHEGMHSGTIRALKRFVS